MSTHAAIIRKTETGTYAGIYCNFDGYLTGLGRLLHYHYQDPEKVAALIALGDISYLEKSVIPDPEKGEHSYANSQEGVVVAYHRDRGEQWGSVKPTERAILKGVVDHIDSRYTYVFEDGVWRSGGIRLNELLYLKAKEGE